MRARRTRSPRVPDVEVVARQRAVAPPGAASTRHRVRRRHERHRRSGCTHGGGRRAAHRRSLEQRARRHHSGLYSSVRISRTTWTLAQHHYRKASQLSIPRAAASALRRTPSRRTRCISPSYTSAGIPDISPEQHRLGHPRAWFGQPLEFTLDTLTAFTQRWSRACTSSNAAAAARRCSPRSRYRERRAGAARPLLLRRMDRRAAVDPDGRGRRRSEGQMAGGRSP